MSFKIAILTSSALIVSAGLILFAGAGRASRQEQDIWAEEPINYLKTPANDSITELQSKIQSGSVKLQYDKKQGWLPATLKALQIPVSSQTLVFSKTSVQFQEISPKTPRAIYFNDRTYVGWVQNGERLEISSIDPQLGPVFYTVSQNSGSKPVFKREDFECLRCHGGGMTRSYPGLLVRSLYVRADGLPEYRAGGFLTADATPLSDRWGGWYVSGTHGKQRHMGNSFARLKKDEVTLDIDAGANQTRLSKYFDTTPYLSRHSDIVSLMVMEHQTQVQNLLVQANYEARIALRYEIGLNRDLKRPADFRSDNFRSRIKSVGEPLIRALLFSDAIEFSDPITGFSGFAEQFSQKGPFDSKRRSLYQLDLKTRLFRYRCSPAIYSALFDGLPTPMKEYVVTRFREILSGKDRSKPFAHLSTADRTAISKMLHETKPGF